MQVKIDSLSKNFQGICYINDFKCFVDDAIPGDILDIEIYKETNKFYFARIKKIIEPSVFRKIDINCKYYHKCGGCLLQHMNLDYYYNAKINNLNKDFKIDEIFKVGFNERRRINLKYKNGVYGFYEKSTTNIAFIDNCLNVTENLNKIIKTLNEKKIKLTNLDSIDIFEVYNGVCINLIFKKDPNINELKKIEFLKDFSILINYTYEDKKSFLQIFKKEDLFLMFDGLEIKLPNDFFMQATEKSQNFMIKTVINELKNFNNVYDLYSGIGTYSFPLSKYNKKVTAFEGSNNMIESIKYNINNLSIKNLFYEKRDLFNNPINDFKNVDAVVLNPPRNGAETQCKCLINSNVKKIIYVSCNPETFYKDYELLKNIYKIKNFFVVDQFFYTKHLEIIAVLSL